MKRTRRLIGWLFDIAAVVSLLLCVAMAAMCIRSRWRCDQWKNPLPQVSDTTMVRDIELDSNDGLILLLSARSSMADIDPGDRGGGFDSEPVFDWRPMLNQVSRPGGLQHRFFTYYSTSHGEGSAVEVIFPYWMPVTALAILPLLEVRYLLRSGRIRRRRLRGLCVTCGYDLRATPERCPECGSAPPGK
jgi:hypothetical protein